MAEQHFGKGYGGNPAANYERFFVPAIGGPLAEELVDFAAVGPGERVLDVACGTGVVARLASQRVGDSGTVAGLDLNPGMLAVARSVTHSGPSIEWHEASADAMPFPDDSFDVVLCQMGLQFMPDRLAALGEMRRVLARDGRLIVNLPGPTPRIFSILEEGVSRHVGMEAARFVSHVFSLNDANEISSLLDNAGFNDVAVHSDTKLLRLPAPAEFLWQYIGSTPLVGAMSQADDKTRESLEREVVARWEEFVDDETLMLEVRVVVAMARN